LGSCRPKLYSQRAGSLRTLVFADVALSAVIVSVPCVVVADADEVDSCSETSSLVGDEVAEDCCRPVGDATVCWRLVGSADADADDDTGNGAKARPLPDLPTSNRALNARFSHRHTIFAATLSSLTSRQAGRQASNQTSKCINKASRDSLDVRKQGQPTNTR
jgi:hypothetical protein